MLGNLIFLELNYVYVTVHELFIVTWKVDILYIMSFMNIISIPKLARRILSVQSMLF